MRSSNRKRLRRLAFLAVVVNSCFGCSQTQHRINADREAYCTIAERNHDPRWSESDLGIDMDPRSRYFDPYNPDCSPMPVDDPASHRYMHCVDGKKGWKHWGRNGVRAQLENPQWRAQLAQYAELTDQGDVKLDVDSAVRLAYVHSPLNQNALETLYLTSLDVTGERFRLDTQFFGGTGLAYRHQGGTTPAAIGFNPILNRYVVSGPFNTPEVNRLGVTNDFSASRRFATAGEVLVGFANSFAFEFTGNDVNLASSLANFSFIQPLLRGAGRDVALEQLTLSERRLLSNLRAYSQFRQGLFTQIVIGELGVTGPQRFGPSTSLQSFSGFGGVNGYLGLLQQSQQIRNTEDNLRLQLRTLARLEALYEAEFIDIVQVDQFRQNIEVTRANLLDQTNGLELAIDNYTTQVLGLPSDLPVELDEQLVTQFQLIPSETTALADELLELQGRVGEVGELLDLMSKVERLSAELPSLAQLDFVEADFALRRLKQIVDSSGRQLVGLPADLEEFFDGNNSSARAGDPSTEGVAKLAEEIGPLEHSAAGGEETNIDPERERRLRRAVAELAGQDRNELETRFRDASQRLERLLATMSDQDGSVAKLLGGDAEWLAEILALSSNVLVVQSEASHLAAEPSQVFADAERLIEPARNFFSVANLDLKRMEEVALQREQSMRPEDRARFRSERSKLRQRLADLETGNSGLRSIVAELQILRAAYNGENRKETVDGLSGWVQSYILLVERLALVPAQARLEVVTVDDVELDAETAFQIALQNRLDFMNGRAALVDRWRAIQVAADALQSNLSITGSGNVGTGKNNPVDFRASTSSLRLGVEFDAPLARLLERNGYREALIDYQRNRRNLIQSQDQLQLGLRALVRTLRQRKLQLEIQRRAVTIAIRRVDQTQLSLSTPPPMGQPGVRPQISPTTAINLLGAQSSLQSSQNSFLAAWLNYYAARIRLYRELGVMQLDPSGKWIENTVDFGSLPSPGETVDPAEALPPPLPVAISESSSAVESSATASERTVGPSQPVVSSAQGAGGQPLKVEKGNPLMRLASTIASLGKNR